MPNPDKTPGQKLVEEWRNNQNMGTLNEHHVFAYQVLEARIDRLIAELTPKRVLDLTALSDIYWEDFDRFVAAIRAQLPDVEVKA